MFSLDLYLDFIVVTANNAEHAISYEQMVANGSGTLTTLSDSIGHSRAHVIQKDDSERLICKRTSPVQSDPLR